MRAIARMRDGWVAVKAMTAGVIGQGSCTS
jgi:hypothetical protein